MNRMTGGELWTVREYLGLTRASLAAYLRVREDTVRRWEVGRERIPERVREEIEALEGFTARAVGDLVTALKDGSGAEVVVYREADDLPADRPDVARLGARWWRHVVARAAHEVRGVTIGTRAELDAIGEDR